ncbi:MAG: ferritin-like domain-containing protein [Sulfurifustis sp.]
MDSRTKMGTNKTGVQMSPIDVDHMLDDVRSSGTSASDGAGIAAVRTTYITEAEPVGTVPVPGTLQGAVSSGVQKMMGSRPEVLVDKLGERLAFERSGTRLYDALLTKYQAMPDKLRDMSAEQLARFRDEETMHFKMVAEAMESLGADPTAQTPGADVVGVESIGLMQVVDDPRTTLSQCLNAMLVVELADNAGWELLIVLAEDMGQSGMAENFRTARTEEQEHLAKIKHWHEQAVRRETSVFTS